MTTKLIKVVDTRDVNVNIVAESHVVGEDSGSWVFLSETPDSSSNVSVSGYTRVTGAPASGQYRPYDSGDYAGGVLFNSSDIGNSVSVSYTGSGTAIFARDINRIHDWLRVTNGFFIEEFGGVADNSTVNDTALETLYAYAAASASLSGGYTIYFGSGSYVFDNVDLGALNQPNITWKGTGQTIFKKDTGGTFNAVNTAHMFRDVSSTGGTDGLRVEGIEFDLSRTSTTSGNTVSAFFFSRVNNLSFDRCVFRDGIEEGLKLYKCQNVYVDDCRFENIRNNGIQIHCPSSDSHTGSRPNQGFKNIYITNCHFYRIDDALGGTADGEAITFNSTDNTVICETGIVTNCVADECIRGWWTEVNTSGSIIRNIQYNNCFISNSISHGAAIIGCENSSINQCHAYNIGSGSALSSEKFAFYIGGSANRPARYCIMSNNTAIDDRTGASNQMDYAYRVQQAQNCSVTGNIAKGALTSSYWFANSTVTNLTLTTNSHIPLLSVQITGSPSISTGGSGVDIPWTQTRLDLLGMHSTGSNPERLTPAWEGNWKVKTNLSFAGNTTGDRRIRILKKDVSSQTIVGLSTARALSDSGEELGLYAESRWVEMSDGDWFQVNAWQNTGGDLTMYASGSWAEMNFIGVINPE